MPSDTLPRATDKSTAPRPLSQACTGVSKRMMEISWAIHPSVILESDTCLVRIWRLHKNQFVLPNFVQNTL